MPEDFGTRLRSKVSEQEPGRWPGLVGAYVELWRLFQKEDLAGIARQAGVGLEKMRRAFREDLQNRIDASAVELGLSPPPRLEDLERRQQDRQPQRPQAPEPGPGNRLAFVRKRLDE
jgi:hypothetical protein